AATPCAGAAAEQVIQIDSGSASAHAAEHLAEDFLGLCGIDFEAAVAGKPAAAAPVEPARPARSCLRPREAELVVLVALGLVAEDVVGVLHFLEGRLRLL